MQFESTPNLTQDETIPREEGRVKTQVTGTITLDENKIEKILGVSALNYDIIRIRASSLERLQYSYPMMFKYQLTYFDAFRFIIRISP